jgi:tetratricopeptide (TPR) repeat protein
MAHLAWYLFRLHDASAQEMTGQQTSPKAAFVTGQRKHDWRVAGVCLVLGAIIFAVFGQTLGQGFVGYDDGQYIVDNPMVTRGLTFKGVVWAFTGAHAFNWHPLTWLSHMLDCQLFGLHPGGHHLTSVLLHSATVISLFLVLRQMTGALWRSAFVAAVFAIHPLRVESVAWVAERKDVLSGLFFMLTLGAYVRYARLPRSAARYGLVAFLFALGLMCKPMLVTLPVVLLLLDYWPLKRVKPGKLSGLMLEKLPLLAISAVCCVVTILAQNKALQTTESCPVPARFANALVSCIVYPGQMVWPAGLAVFYPYPRHGFPLWEVASAGLLLAGLSAVVMWQRRKQPWLLTGWVWYLVMLLPVLGIIQVGNQAHADRYTYLPGIGIYAAITWLAGECGARLRAGRAVVGCLMVTVLTVLMICAWKQTTYWQNGETLWTHALACTTDNFEACNGLGVALNQEGRVDEAITCLEKAVQINPKGAVAHNNLGLVLLSKGRVDESIVHCQEALQLRPEYKETHVNLGNAFVQKGRMDEAIAEYQAALAIDSDYADAHNNLANALLARGKVDEAIAEYHDALKINPNYADAKNNLEIGLRRRDAPQIGPGPAEALCRLGDALLQKGRVDEAIEQFQKALQTNPGHAKARNNLGSAFLQKGNSAEAAAQFQEALQLEPEDPWPKNNLAWVLATSAEASLRDGRKAVELAEQASHLKGGENPIILHTLAAAYAEAGRYAEAMATAQHALRLAGAQSNARLGGQLKSEMKLYQSGNPFHVSAQKP